MREYKTISTGFESVDKILSFRGGVPRGCIVEIYGPAGNGKTTLATLMAANAQKQEVKVGWIDAEDGLDYTYSTYLGLDYDLLYEERDLVIPDTAEQGLQKVVEWADSGYGLVIVDSITALVPEIAAEAEIGDSNQYAPLAGMMAKELSKMRRKVRLGNTALVFINQIRGNIPPNRFAKVKPTRPAVGFALGFYASLRLEVRFASDIKYGQNIIGFTSCVKAQKNRFAPPKRPAYFSAIFDSTIPEDLRNKKLAKEVEKYDNKQKAIEVQEEPGED